MYTFSNTHARNMLPRQPYAIIITVAITSLAPLLHRLMTLSNSCPRAHSAAAASFRRLIRRAYELAHVRIERVCVHWASGCRVQLDHHLTICRHALDCNWQQCRCAHTGVQFIVMISFHAAVDHMRHQHFENGNDSGVVPLHTRHPLLAHHFGPL
jgi:hypothetical protein